MKTRVWFITAIVLISFLSIPTKAQIAYDEIAYRINEIVCSLINIILWVIGLIASAIVVFRGVEYVTAENPDERSEIKDKIIHVIIALVIAMVAMAFVNYLIENTDIMPFTCTHDGYQHPGTCAIPGPNEAIYCCCEREGVFALQGDHCPYGASVSDVGNCLPIGETCSTYCLARSYLSGTGSIRHCACEMPPPPPTTTI